jgi:hypothetical protein
VSGEQHPPDRNSDDWLLAQQLAMGNTWDALKLQMLRDLVKRNEHTGDPLGREGYIAMRDLLSRVEPFIAQLCETRRWLLDPESVYEGPT